MADERDPQNRFKDDDEDYNNEEEEDDEDYEEVEEGGKGALTGFLILFIILFLVSTGLLFYYQFYQGSDGWNFTFKKDTIGKAEVQKLKKKNNQLEKQVDTLKSRLNRTQTKLADAKSGQSQSGLASKGGAEMSGTYYEVQIGAFKSFSFDRYGDQVTNLRFHRSNGLKKLTLGQFKEANAARAFRRDLVRLGLKDAFIVEMRDGQRVEIIESY